MLKKLTMIFDYTVIWEQYGMLNHILWYDILDVYELSMYEPRKMLWSRVRNNNCICVTATADTSHLSPLLLALF